MITHASAGGSPAHDIDSRYAWTRLGVALALGTVGSVGMWSVVVALPAVQADFGVARGDASLPFTLTMIGFGVGGVVMGRLADRFGVVRPLLIGMVALVAGYVLSAFATNVWLFALAQTLIGFGASGSFGPIMTDISHWFEKRRGIAVAVASCGNYLSGTLWPPLIQYLISHARLACDPDRHRPDLRRHHAAPHPGTAAAVAVASRACARHGIERHARHAGDLVQHTDGAFDRCGRRLLRRDVDAAGPHLRRALRLDALQIRLPRADGEPALVAITAVPLVDEAGTFRGARGVARDLTENHRRDEALAEAEQRARTLAHVARAVRDAEGPAAALDAALLAVVRATGAGGGGIWRRDGEKLEPSAAFGDASPAGFVPTIATTATEVASAETVAAGVRRLVAPTSFRHRPNGALAIWRPASEPAWTPTESSGCSPRSPPSSAWRWRRSRASASSSARRAPTASPGCSTGAASRPSSSATAATPGAACGRRRWSTSTSTTSSRSTTATDTRAATLCCVRSRTSSATPRASATSWRGWAATSSRSGWPTPISHGARAKAAALLAIAGEIGAFSAAPELPLGLSVGVALWSPEDGETVAQLLERADHAMYAAKRGGKGRVSFAPPLEKTKA